MVKAKVLIYSKPFDGPAKVDNFSLVEEELPALKDEEFLAEALFLSVDPYMRAYAPFQEIGKPYIGGQVGRYVVGSFGWRTHSIWNPSKNEAFVNLPSYLLPDIGDLSPSLGLGVLGMPGNTAYFGFLEIIQPKAGETLVVSGAAGAVGSLVGQIGKIKGLKVIGIAGSDEKGKWLINELGFDHFINYKTENVAEKLNEYASEGIDCYFDNVGGDVSAAVYQNMKLRGRISICGTIAAYDGDDSKAQIDQRIVLFKQLKIEGFIVTRWNDRWMEGIKQNLEWIKQGKLKFKETVTEGFENMPKAFINMMNGGNTGKAIIKA